MDVRERQTVTAYVAFALILLAFGLRDRRKGVVDLPLRGFIRITLHRRLAPVRFWLCMSGYVGGIAVLLYGVWRTVQG